MASALQKLLRKPPPLPFKFITAVNPSSQLQNPILTVPSQCHPQPSPTSPAMQQFDSPTVIFPSFPFGFFPKPVFESGFRSLDDGVEEDSGTVWADSVKKKRKRKMNKHKYQKLRKRMRRQS
ncbi:hypothetical protein PHAVU_004G059700 [Phaseolus vulgaris]|uniref:Small ribosomal subunit protein mS38 n=1 Tax=Phaseolus vulgaris TaxID=3885 RepID=V7C0B0_PHAVU|nr:hypothetical protein PHAVU_004G059700g [Phaseolus vulgaris]ESW23584.1 hypothetical protein PHAVU_004G059700g [Phaseolus vulgaris]